MPDFLNVLDAMVFLWLLLTIIFVVVEMLTVGLTSIWFAAGAFVAMLAAVFRWNSVVQVLLFLVVSIGLLLGTRTWARKFINGRTQKTNADRVIGQVIRITECVNNVEQTGTAVVAGQEWTVRTKNEKEVIAPGEFARVLEISGVKLIVEKV